ncbi:MAG: PIN domain-containing protein [Terriglobia bacterium]
MWAERRSALHDRALMTSFEDRAGADKVEELLAKAAEGKGPLAMSVVNWGEVYYSVWRARGEKAAAVKLQDIARLPIEVVGVDMELARLATRLNTPPLQRPIPLVSPLLPPASLAPSPDCLNRRSLTNCTWVSSIVGV